MEEITQREMVGPSQPRLKSVFLISLFWVWIAFVFQSFISNKELQLFYLGLVGTFTASSWISFLKLILFLPLFQFLPFFYAGETSANPVLTGALAFFVTIPLPAIIATFLGFLTFRYRRLIPFLLFILPLLFFLGAILKYNAFLFSTFVPAITFAWIAKRNKPEEIKNFFRTGLWIGIRVLAIAVAVFIPSSILGNFAEVQGRLWKTANIWKTAYVKQEINFLRTTYLPAGVNKFSEYEVGGTIEEHFSCGSYPSLYNWGPFRISQSPLSSKVDTVDLYTSLAGQGKYVMYNNLEVSYAEVQINNNRGFYIYGERDSDLIWKTDNSIIRIVSEDVCGHSKEELIKIAQSMQP